MVEKVGKKMVDGDNIVQQNKCIKTRIIVSRTFLDTEYDLSYLLNCSIMSQFFEKFARKSILIYFDI